jgi:peptidoglycan hydrolase-like protein with peptidoglycan-binding domain
MRLVRNPGVAIAVVVAGSVLFAALAMPALTAATAKRKTGAKRPVASSATAARRTATQSHPARRPSRAKRSLAGRRVPSRQRLARLRLEPERVREIQQALIQAGYLNQAPTGAWDDATRNAMRRYQADNSFPTTGLPEAKSLLKLGLGSHPLPPELDTAGLPERGTASNQPSPAAASSQAQ